MNALESATGASYVAGEPRQLKDPDSFEYAVQMLSYLKTMFSLKEASVHHWDTAVAEAEQYRIYERLPSPDHPYGGIEELLEAEIGCGKEEAHARKLHTYSEAGKMGGRGHKGFRNTKPFNSETVEYKLARLERDHPDQYERVQSGQLSANAAAIEAGFRKPNISIPVDPDRVARYIRMRWSDPDIARLIDALQQAPEA